MVANRSMPVDTVLPHITYRNVAEASRWLTATFGFAEHWRAPDPFDDHGSGRGPGIPRDALRLGVMFSDGHRAATTGGHPWPHDADADRLVLLSDGGGGGGRRWDANFWVYPLPPGGPVTLVVSWPKYDVAETRAELDGAAIREAAGRAVILWPDDPDSEPGSSWTTGTMTASAHSTDTDLT